MYGTIANKAVTERAQLNTRHLEYFLAIVDYGGFNRAAEKLRVAQPSLSQAIRGLERDLKVTLFVRTSRHSTLTDVGKSLVEPIRQILRELNVIQSISLERDQELHGDVGVAMSSSVAYGVLPKVAKDLRSRHPMIKLAVHPIADLAQAVELVRSGICDLGLATGPEAPRGRGLQSAMVYKDRFLVIAPPGMFSARTTLTRKQLRGTRFVVGERAVERARLEEDFAILGIYPQIAVWAGHSEAVIPLVLAGVGADMFPASRADLARLGGADIFEIDPIVPVRQWIVARSGGLSLAADAFYASATSQPKKAGQ